MAELKLPGRRLLILHGIAWSALFQVVQTLLGFGAMLVLVRIIPPTEYGRVGVVLGFLTLLNACGCGMFLAQAIQLDESFEPDWSLHWSAAFYIQGGLSVVCHLFAGVCWLLVAYRPIAPLLHLAAVGLLLDWPNRVGATMLRREMEFRRFQVLYGLGTFASVAVTLIVGYWGGGAYAIVLGSNVVLATPFAIDLLIARGWRPRQGWWRSPNWTAYKPALRFGFRQLGSVLLAGVRGSMEAVVLPGAVGYAGIGLLNRAQALLSTTVIRAGNVLAENIYPLLPRSAGDRLQYARRATFFVQVLLLVTVPGSLYVGLEGRALSRVLYGKRWVLADPLFCLAAVASAGLVCFALGTDILRGANRLRVSLAVEVGVAALWMPVVAVVWTGGDIVAYAWAVAAGQAVAAAIALRVASPLLARGWVRSAMLPPLVSGLLAACAVLGVERMWGTSVTIHGLVVGTCVYGLALGLVRRAVFPSTPATLLSRIPAGERVCGWLGLPPDVRMTVA